MKEIGTMEKKQQAAASEYASDAATASQFSELSQSQMDKL